jgi:hypothetical protein
MIYVKWFERFYEAAHVTAYADVEIVRRRATRLLAQWDAGDAIWTDALPRSGSPLTWSISLPQQVPTINKLFSICMTSRESIYLSARRANAMMAKQTSTSTLWGSRDTVYTGTNNSGEYALMGAEGSSETLVFTKLHGVTWQESVIL